MSTLLVLAAGMGSRYGGLKQLDGVGPGGEFLLDYSVYDAVHSGFRKVVFLIRKEFEDEFRQKVGARYEGQIQVDYAFQDLQDLPGNRVTPEGRQKPWGTGHAIWAAREKIDTPFLTVNADDFYGSGAYAAMELFLSKRWQPGRAALVAYQLQRTMSENGSVSRGICSADEAEKLTSVEECSNIHRTQEGAILGLDSGGIERPFVGNEWVSMNFWGFGPDIFEGLESLLARFLDEGGLADPKAEFYIPAAVTDLIGQEKLTVSMLQTWDNWFGMTYREDRPIVEAALCDLVKNGLYPASLGGKL